MMLCYCSLGNMMRRKYSRGLEIMKYLTRNKEICHLAVDEYYMIIFRSDYMGMERPAERDDF
jgi:hypothetical protein